MAITFRQLEIFIAVAETQQVTRASKKLLLTQSAVSMALGELENQLGGPLFDRHGRSLLLNDRGRYLLPLAKAILHQVANIETILTEQQDTVAGVLGNRGQFHHRQLCAALPHWRLHAAAPRGAH